MKLNLQTVLEQRKQDPKIKTDFILPVPWINYKDTYNKAFEEVDPNQTDYLLIASGNSFSSRVIPQSQIDDQSIIYEILGPERKVVLSLYHQWYHFLLDTLVYVYKAWLDDPNTHFVFIKDITHIEYFNDQLIPFLYRFLAHFNITNFTFIEKEDTTKRKILKINNYYYKKLDFGSDLYWICNEFINDMFPQNDIEPFRKVYVSRRKNYVKPSDGDGFVEKGFDTSRVGDEEAVEDYFSKYGWEIMYPEDFDSIDDQIQYVREAKYLMGATSAGLINACFMKPGTNVIELLTTIAMWENGTKRDAQRTEFHVLYTVMCWSLSLLHLSIPNIKDEKALFEFIENNEYARQIIQDT